MKDEKYRILSAHSVVNMVVNFKLNEEEAQPQAVTVGVDYAEGRVLFTSERILGVDYDALEKQILDFIRPGEVKVPVMLSQEIIDRITKVRAGEYKPNMANFQG